MGVPLSDLIGIMLENLPAKSWGLARVCMEVFLVSGEAYAVNTVGVLTASGVIVVVSATVNVSLVTQLQ